MVDQRRSAFLSQARYSKFERDFWQSPQQWCKPVTNTAMTEESSFALTAVQIPLSEYF